MISQPPPPSITEDQSVPKEWLGKEQTYRTPNPPPPPKSQSAHKRHGEHELLLAGSQVRQPHTAISASSHMSSRTHHSCPSTSFPHKLITQTSPPRKARPGTRLPELRTKLYQNRGNRQTQDREQRASDDASYLILVKAMMLEADVGVEEEEGVVN